MTLHFPESFYPDLVAILNSSNDTPGGTVNFLRRWRVESATWRDENSRDVLDLTVLDTDLRRVQVEIRASDFQKELKRQEIPGEDETPYEALLGDISSLVQELFITRNDLMPERIVLPPY